MMTLNQNLRLWQSLRKIKDNKIRRRSRKNLQMMTDKINSSHQTDHRMPFAHNNKKTISKKKNKAHYLTVCSQFALKSNPKQSDSTLNTFNYLFKLNYHSFSRTTNHQNLIKICLTNSQPQALISITSHLKKILTTSLTLNNQRLSLNAMMTTTSKDSKKYQPFKLKSNPKLMILFSFRTLVT